MNRYYKIMNLAPGSTRAAVKQAFRQLAHLWHPDKFVHRSPELRKMAEHRFMEIRMAFEKLWATDLPDSPRRVESAFDVEAEVLGTTKRGALAGRKEAATPALAGEILDMAEKAADAPLRHRQIEASGKRAAASDANKRRYPRMGLHLLLKVVHEDIGPVADVETEDVTIEGVSFRSLVRMIKDSLLYVEFPAVKKAKKSRVYAKVIRCDRIAGSEPRLYRIAAQYVFDESFHT